MQLLNSLSFFNHPSSKFHSTQYEQTYSSSAEHRQLLPGPSTEHPDFSQVDQSQQSQSKQVHLNLRQVERYQPKQKEITHGQQLPRVHSNQPMHLITQQGTNFRPQNFLYPGYQPNGNYDKKDNQMQLLAPLSEKKKSPDTLQKSESRDNQRHEDQNADVEVHHNKKSFQSNRKPTKISERDFAAMFAEEQHPEQPHHFSKEKARLPHAQKQHATEEGKTRKSIKNGNDEQKRQENPQKAYNNFYFKEYSEEEHGCEKLSCPAFECPIGVYRYDLDTGCLTCDCCEMVDCFDYCEHGYESDEQGCPICECADPMDEDGSH